MSFYDNLLTFKDNIAALTDTGAQVTYGEKADFATRLNSKINQRCLVFCLCENSLGSLCGYLAFLKNRIVPLLLDKDLNSALFATLLDTYQPAYLWAPDSQSSGFAAAGYTAVLAEYGYTLFKTNFDVGYPLFPELALLLTTSGSTGSPKLVRQSYQNIDANAAAIVKYLDIGVNERPITTLPMNYTYGLSIINSHLLRGATMLLTSKTLLEKEFWRFFKEQRATSFGGVPYTYEMLKKLRFFRMDLPSLQTMTQAGGKLTVELTREFVEFAQSTNRRFFVMYGQTEATARMAYLPHEYAVSKCGSMGVAIPGGEFSLIDDYGKVITTAETVGELVYKGPNVTLGYAECGEDLAKGDEWNGVLVTGDMAERDADGFYYITGRKKRFIKLYGNRVNLDEAERLVKTIISECACTGKDDHMVIYITETGREDQVRRFIAAKTGINPIAFEVKWIKEIPKNEAGKTVYSKL
jgi:acyl-coenzyme A synthetase/AMP-(fatty) acid ligase